MRPPSVNFAILNLWAPTARVAGPLDRRSSLLDAVETEWGSERRAALVVLTGGEPLLQIDRVLIEALHDRGFAIAVETNGTIEPPSGLDWICVSPKAGAELRVRSGDEIKLVFPQSGAPPGAFAGLAFRHFSLQPMDGPRSRTIQRAPSITACAIRNGG